MLTACLVIAAAPVARAIGPTSQNFDSVSVGTESAVGGTLTINALVYSTDATNDQLHVDTIANVTGNLPSLGSGNALASVWLGTNTGTYFQFASTSNSANFKITSINAEVFGHTSQNCEIYTLKGYDNGTEVASATVNFRVTGTYGTGSAAVSYNRLTTVQETTDSNDDANAGTITFSGSAWGNVDQVRFIVADSAPNTILGVNVDNIVIGSPASPPTVTSPTNTNIAATTITLGGNVTSDGGATVTERGVVYALTSANSNPRISGSGVTKVTGTGTTGVFTVSVTGLTAGSAYTYAAYAINSIGTTYSANDTFTSYVNDVTGIAGAGAAFNNAQPTLAVRWMICTSNAVFPVRDGGLSSGDPVLGEVRAFASTNNSMTGWVACDGSLLPISQNAALFSILGTTYGGNGTSTFALPDLRGRVVVGAGQGNGLSDRVLGLSSGAETATLAITNLPAHTHSLSSGTTGSTGNGTPFDSMQPWIALTTFITSSGDFTTEIGWVRLFAGNFAPGGYECTGQLVPIAQENTLYAKIGTIYGGDGLNTFAVPDLRGRVVIGIGQGSGLTNRVLGEASGSETVTLTTSTLPAHTHTIVGGNTGATGGNGAHNTMQPYLALNWIMATAGIFGAPSGSDPALSELRLWAPNALPSSGWAAANGAALAIAQNQALFALVGTAYGGNGTTTFGVPDTRGRALAHVGTGIGLSNRVAGEQWGAESVTLLLTQLPAHTHAYAHAPAANPTVASVAVPASSTYKIGASLDFTVNFSNTVNVVTTGGTPTLSLTVGSTARTASYQSGSGSTALVFRYTVPSGDLDSDGIALGSGITLNGGTIKDGSSNDATLTLNSVASTASVKVDGVKPTVVSVVRKNSAAQNLAANTTTASFRVTYSEALNATPAPARFAIESINSGTVSGTIGTPTFVSAGVYDVDVTITGGSGEFRLKVID